MVDKNHICIYNICVQIILKGASFVGRFKAFKNPHNVTDMSPCDVDRQISLLAKGNISQTSREIKRHVLDSPVHNY